MNDAVWLGIDLGTQSVRAILADDAGAVLATSAHPLTSRRSGREHTQSPDEWWQAVCACCRAVTAAVGPAMAARLAGLAIDATSGTILLTDAQLAPVSDTLMYDDGRAGAEAAQVQERGRALWSELGYAMQPSWALPKLLWLWRHGSFDHGADLRLTHQNDFIHQRLAGVRLVTDASHALKSGYDAGRDRWPVSLLEDLGLPAALFPKVVAPGSLIGAVSIAAAAETGLPAGLAIVSGMTDGCAAQIASGAVGEGSWNSVLGTTLVVKGVTTARLHDPLGVVYSHRSADGMWLPGGASSTGAGAIAQNFAGANLDALAREAERRGVSSLVTYPLATTGERFPFFAPEATGFASRAPHDAAEQYRAILQGVAFLERLSFDYLRMLGAPMGGELSISGGATRSRLWNQIRADVLGRTLTIAAVTEPAFGMAVLAAAARSSITEAATRMVRTGGVLHPAVSFAASYGELYRNLLDQLERRGWLPAALAAFSRARIEAA